MSIEGSRPGPDDIGMGDDGTKVEAPVKPVEQERPSGPPPVPNPKQDKKGWLTHLREHGQAVKVVGSIMAGSAAATGVEAQEAPQPGMTIKLPAMPGGMTIDPIARAKEMKESEQAAEANKNLWPANPDPIEWKVAECFKDDSYYLITLAATHDPNKTYLLRISDTQKELLDSETKRSDPVGYVLKGHLDGMTKDWDKCTLAAQKEACTDTDRQRMKIYGREAEAIAKRTDLKFGEGQEFATAAAAFDAMMKGDDTRAVWLARLKEEVAKIDPSVKVGGILFPGTKSLTIGFALVGADGKETPGGQFVVKATGVTFPK